jgi:N-acetylglucosaminyldiphosphoundecaprenol N-acetyl-beta-D-mannosaminyltransferase
MRVDATSYDDAGQRIMAWAHEGRHAYVCAANVHMCMEAHDHTDFRAVVNGADLVTPDGMPLVWMLRRLGCRGQSRVYGPDLVLHVLQRAAQEGIPVGLYGGSPTTLERLMHIYPQRFPGLKLVYAHSPPFRLLSDEEDAVIQKDIAASGVRILLVGLGCPKQERWMAAHKEGIAAVQMGIGAAFAFHAGEVKQAPRWMQAMSMEWFYRMLVEPRRLWWRYAWNNPRFIVLALWELMDGGGVRADDAAR